MSAPEVFSFGTAPLTAHAFNADRSQVAVCPNTNELHIYARSGNSWTLTATLTEHDKVITSIDWAPQTNRIVTCSQDRNAYVWTLTLDAQTGQSIWKPTLVLLRINRAATCVRWSPLENKFAVASGARAIAVCSFDAESDWWVSKHIKKPLRSTVLSLDWHPNNVLLAAGSADARARVFSAYIKDVDEKPAPSVWGERLPFNTVCGEFAPAAGGWVHAVGFSPRGDVLAFASHDSTVTIVYPSGPSQPPAAVISLRVPSLPFTTLAWTREDTLVAAGHDCQPILLSSTSGSWAITKSLDDSKSGPSSAPRGTVGRLNNLGAFQTFKGADSRGVSGGSGSGDTVLNTVHQNTITLVRAYEGQPGDVRKVSTSGVDGKLCVWDVEGGSVEGLVARTGAMSV